MNSSIVQYSPNSEESDEQPLDFSKTRISAALRSIASNPIKNENMSDNNNRVITPEEPQRRNSSTTASANCFTTPSPSPPELHNIHNNHNNHTNQVLCQLLTGNLIPTSTGKLVPVRNNTPISLQMQSEQLLRMNGGTQSSPIMSSSPQHVMQAINSVMNEKHNSPLSPIQSASPIGLGPLNQVEMHFTHSPNASGVDRFGTSGGLLTTASTAGVFAGNENMKRALKYSRPFKAYPRDPLSIPMSYYGVPLQIPLTADAIATQSLLVSASDQDYLRFREQMLVSRKSSQERERQETRRSSVTKSLHNNSSTSTSSTPERMPEIHNNNNGNNNTHHQNHQNHQNIYLNQSLTPSKEMIAPLLKTNGSASMTPMTNSQIHSDENSQYSNANSSGNSSGAEGEMGSMASNAGHSDALNMRKRGRPLPEDLKDEAYWERRRKNNEAAKRSRDARRAKEDEIAIRAAFLEQENLKLRMEIAGLKAETQKLRCLLYTS